MLFRLVTNPMTLNDLETTYGVSFAIFSDRLLKNFAAHQAKQNEDTHIETATKI